jgi:hypothetical protein
MDSVLGRGSAMVWAGICHDGCTQLKIVQGTLNAVKYRDDILDPIVLPFLQHLSFDHVFQHENARCHVVRWIKACGMLFHSCTSASRSSCSGSGGF